MNEYHVWDPSEARPAKTKRSKIGLQCTNWVNGATWGMTATSQTEDSQSPLHPALSLILQGLMAELAELRAQN